ncbi:hypothetical protein Tco_0001237 [Tanacetum coccineum]
MFHLLSDVFLRIMAKEKKLDDGLVKAFWVKYDANKQVAYQEVMVRNKEETVAAIRAINSDYDLWIVGRKLGINPILIKGLSSWSESLKLKVIGGILQRLEAFVASSIAVEEVIVRNSLNEASIYSCQTCYGATNKGVYAVTIIHGIPYLSSCYIITRYGVTP